MDSLKTEKIRISKQGDVFITKTATLTLTNPTTVEKVMNFHFRDLLKALSTYKSVEITGFGKFTLSQNKLKRRLKELYSIRERAEKLLEEKVDCKNEEDLKRRLNNVNKDIAYLEARNQEDETKSESYFRRMAQSLATPSQVEGGN
jgi:nucleoid DNA-binding protein